MNLVLKVENDCFKIFVDNKLMKTVPAYIYEDEKGDFIFGKFAYRAIELYSYRITNLSTAIIKDDYEMQLRIMEYINKYIKETYKILEYDVEVLFYTDKNFISNYKKIKNVNIKKMDIGRKLYIMENGNYELFTEFKELRTVVADGELVELFNNYIANNLTNLILKNYGELSFSNHEKIRNIIMLRIEFYKNQLFLNGDTEIYIKIVDDNYIVHKLQCNLKKEAVLASEIIELVMEMKTNNEKKIRGNLEYRLFDDQFKVTLISPFSYGKSTIFNGIIGNSILNMDIRAETAIITKICSSSMNKVYIKYKSGKILTYSYEDDVELKNLIANCTGVRNEGELPREVQILYKLNNLPNITLIDSPGLFSPHKDHNAIAEEALEMSDLILFVVNPGRIGDVNFTEKIKTFVEYIIKNDKKFAFILSKYDLYEQETEVILREFDKVLENLQLQGSKVFFVSGYFALKGRQLKENKIDIEEIRKSRDIYVSKQEDFISGKKIVKEHCFDLINFSNIESLEKYILTRGRDIEGL
ncbi:dynamin family protein [Clostridium estertheticum]|uniref:Dynamin N-terminal domain-containing protein n=1 Tax=Clostridium estertheticum TaxID=238834 RepID=A0A7Y3T0A7_9CLOT|nr:dynamin family protein [Clostridium estertheticum]NNU78355.1 hypothetical protein [Clostridium estertheticum]WBL45291.1 dynamin family protein [Clostridium estertheticum]